MSQRIDPHGGDLKVLYLADDEVSAAKHKSVELPSWPLTQRQLCDIKLLLNGGFSPLTGFLNEADYNPVLEAMRLADGTLWPMPVTLDVTEAAVESLSLGDRLALRDHEGWLIAILTIGSIWRPDKHREAERVYATTDEEHPGVDYLLNRAHAVYLGGRLEGIEKSVDHDFIQHRHEPAELRQLFDQRGWSRVVAYQTRTPMHRAHQELAARAAQMLEANLLVHPVVGMTQPGDIDHFSRVRCYEHVLTTFPEQTTMLSLLELAMRMAGPREALWHALIRKNYGCSHFIVGSDLNRQPFLDRRLDHSGHIRRDVALHERPESGNDPLGESHHDHEENHSQDGEGQENAHVADTDRGGSEHLVVARHAVQNYGGRKTRGEGQRELEHGDAGQHDVLGRLPGPDQVVPGQRLDRHPEGGDHHQHPRAKPEDLQHVAQDVAVQQPGHGLIIDSGGQTNHCRAGPVEQYQPS